MIDFTPVAGANYKHDYPAIFRAIAAGRMPEIDTYRALCKNDLFFLLCFGLQRVDVNHPWIVDRIREVEADHTDTLDLWAREHYKSTILTYGLPIQELVKNPDERICIFSHTRGIAKGFLRQIKQTLEDDIPLKHWFADIFYPHPKKEAPKWSEDDGLVIRRRSNPKEASIEAWGIVDGQPTSKHFTTRIYDDLVTDTSVTTPEQLKKSEDAFSLSHSLGTDGGTKRVIGTHYHFADLYMALKKNPSYRVRIYPATHDGTATGAPVMLSQARLDELRRDQSSYVFSCQQLLNPIAADEQKFKQEWIKEYTTPPHPMNQYILVDPANEKKKKSDYTTLAVIGICPLGNRYLLKLVRDKLNLRERWELCRDTVRAYPKATFFYEKYGKDSDDFYFGEQQQAEGVYFTINTMAGNVSKQDRILRLQPICEHGRFYVPRNGLYHNSENMVQVFIDEEYLRFPFAAHDDLLDVISRIEDPEVGATAPMTGATGYGSGMRNDYIESRTVAGL